MSCWAVRVFLSPAFDGALHVTLRDAYEEVRVWLMPFCVPPPYGHISRILRTFEGRDTGGALSTVAREPHMRHVLVAHQYVTGAATCDSEILSLGGTDQVGASLFDGFDYVALGICIPRKKLCGGRVRYCGSPLKYSLSEERQRKGRAGGGPGAGGTARRGGAPLCAPARSAHGSGCAQRN